MKRFRKWVIPIVCGITLICLMRFVFFIGYVPSASMEPTVKEGSYIFGYRLFGDLNSGDIIVFQKDHHIHIKRIAAVAGDIVYIDDADHIVSVNVEIKTATRFLTVPDSCFFVLGDNMEDSFDSRYWPDPFVRSNDIKARLPR